MQELSMEANPGFSPKVLNGSKRTIRCSLAFPWKVADIRLSQRNTGKRLEVIVIAPAGKLDGCFGRKPKQCALGGELTITSSIYIMAGEVVTMAGAQLIPGMPMLPI